jgi:hypothetical protein
VLEIVDKMEDFDRLPHVRKIKVILGVQKSAANIRNARLTQ